MDISAWLRELGLERYEQAFRENNIDGKIIPKLTAEDLKDLGVTLVGDRRRLLDAIASLQAASQTPTALAPQVAEPGIGRSAPTAEAERRQLTVMFVDLVGSTEHSRRPGEQLPHDARGDALQGTRAAGEHPSGAPALRRHGGAGGGDL